MSSERAADAKHRAWRSRVVRLSRLLAAVPRLAAMKRLSRIPGVKGLAIETPNAGVCTNPTIAVHDGKTVVAMRELNYRIEPSGKYTALADEGFLSQTWVSYPLESPKRLSDLASEGYTNLEDPRLYVAGGDLRIMWSMREGTSSDAGNVIVTARLDGTDLSSWRRLNSPYGRRVEKNWMPYSGDLEDEIVMYDLAWVERYRAGDDLQRLSRAVHPIPHLKRHSGSSQFIRWDDGWIGVSHWYVETIGPLKRIAARLYAHHFVWFSADHSCGRLSAPFFFMERGVEFCAGIARRDDAIILTFGLADRRAAALEVEMSVIYKFMQRGTGFRVETV